MECRLPIPENERVSLEEQNDQALAQPPRENAGDTPHAQAGAGAEPEGEGGCCQQRLVLPSLARI